MRALTNLNIQSNSFSGSVPSTISSLSLLRTIYLNSNSLQGALPEIGALSNLQFIDVSFNRFAGGIPSSWGSLSSLTYLSLMSDTNLCGNATWLYTNLSSIAAARGLSFTFAYTGSSYLLNSAATCAATQLSDQSALLYWRSSLVSSSLPSSWLASSDPCAGWAGVGCDGAVPAAVVNISLAGYGIQGSIPAVVSTYSYVGTTYVTTTTAALALGSLTSLDLSGNSLSGIIGADLGGLTSAGSLRSLSLRGNSFVSSIPSTVWNLQALTYLDLSNCSFQVGPCAII